MPRIRLPDQALTLAIPPPHRAYICRACLAQGARQFSISRRIDAELPFFQRMRNSIFGSKESNELQKQREAAQQRKLEKTKAQGQSADRLTRSGGFEIAEIVDPSTHEDYIASNTWEGLESIGSAEWIKAKDDRGEQYSG